MDYHQTFAISSSGLAAERARLDVSARNLASQYAAAPDVQHLYQPQQVVTRAAPGFARQMQLQGVLSTVTAQAVAPRRVHEPGHPYADAQGMVLYPGVDHLGEMLTLNQALRSYEANLAVLGAVRTVALRSLEIGSQS